MRAVWWTEHLGPCGPLSVPALCRSLRMESVVCDDHAAVTAALGGRDRFLDTLRTLALVRVMLWHAFGAPVLTYVVAAVPTMFFVTGSLLAKSLNRRSWPCVVADRLRRVLVPLWVFAVVAVVAMRIAWLIDPSVRTRLRWQSIVFWVVPLGDPKGSQWEAGWLSQPLWYLRALFWLFLLSPVLRAAMRRFGSRALLTPLVVVFALDVVARNPRWALHAAPDLVWQLGDLALYSIFVLAGFAHHEGRFDRFTPTDWFTGAVLAAGAAATWITTQPVPLGVVNNSHPAHLFVGTAWLCVLFGCRAPISRFAARPLPGFVVDWVSQRTMTIYLWHSTAIILTYQILAHGDHYPLGAYAMLMIVGMVSVTALFVALFGWVEDLAARRKPKICPLVRAVNVADSEGSLLRRQRRNVRVVLAAPALVGAFVVATTLAISGAHNPAGTGADATGAGAARTKRPPVPSQAPPRPQFDYLPAGELATTPAIPPNPAVTASPAPETAPIGDTVIAPAADATLSDLLEQTLDAWRVRWNVPGIVVGVARPGVTQWQGASGADQLTGLAVHDNDTFDIASVTKTFTGAIVFQLAAEHKIVLDAPLPRLDRVPGFAYDANITVRMLLEHRSGLMPYRDTPTFAANPDAIDTPAKALDASLHEPLMFTPGSQSSYSTTNYLVLGYLIEQITGQPFDTVLNERIIDPLGLRDITHLAPGPQTPNFATSGLVTDTTTLLHWAIALYRDHTIIDADAVAAMNQFDPDTGLGPASFGYCPCTIDDHGTRHWKWIGHSGATTQLVYDSTDDTAIAVNVTDSLWLADRGRAIAELIETIDTTIDNQNTPTPPDQTTGLNTGDDTSSSKYLARAGR